MLIEYKDLSTGAVTDVDTKGRRVSGYLSTWTQDSHQDIIEQGAFAKTLQERRDQIFFLNQHNWSEPHGKFDELREDSKGLYFVSGEMPNTSYSKDALELYERGIMTDHSIGFITIKSDFDRESNVRHIKELKLYEGSNVTIGANRNTPFMGFKSDEILKQIQDKTTAIMKALRDGSFTDDTFLRLEIALKQLQADAVEYGKSLSKSQEPSQDTQDDMEPIIATFKSFNQQFRHPKS